jgi:hypothetical protein
MHIPSYMSLHRNFASIVRAPLLRLSLSAQCLLCGFPTICWSSPLENTFPPLELLLIPPPPSRDYILHLRCLRCMDRQVPNLSAAALLARCQHKNLGGVDGWEAQSAWGINRRLRRDVDTAGRRKGLSSDETSSASWSVFPWWPATGHRCLLCRPGWFVCWCSATMALPAAIHIPRPSVPSLAASDGVWLKSFSTRERLVQQIAKNVG